MTGLFTILPAGQFVRQGRDLSFGVSGVCAVIVSVTVAVFAAETGAVYGCAVKDEAHAGELLLRIQAFDFGEHNSVKQSGANHKQGSVAAATDNLGIGHHLYRRAVDKYVIILAAKFVYKLCKARRLKKFRRVGRRISNGQYAQIGRDGITYNQRVYVVGLADKVVCEASTRCANVHGGGHVSQVSVYYEHFLVTYGKCDTKVYADKRFS